MHVYKKEISTVQEFIFLLNLHNPPLWKHTTAFCMGELLFHHNPLNMGGLTGKALGHLAQLAKEKYLGKEFLSQ